MKIDGNNGISGSLKVGFREDPVTVQERAETSSVERPEPQISLSAKSVENLKAQLGKLPDVRQNKVQALQKAVHNGSYQVDNHRIADAMSAELFGSGNARNP